MITAIEITRHRTRSTAAADNLAKLSRQPGRGRFHFIKVRLNGDGPHVHVGYAEELPDCIRVYDNQWQHVGTAPTITDALAVVASRADTIVSEPTGECDCLSDLPAIVITGSRS